MKIVKLSLPKLIITGIILLNSFTGFSQLTNTLYFMKGVPQVYQMNPALQPGCKFFLGFPALSPLQLKVQEHPFALSDLVYWNDEAGQYITPYHHFGDKQAFLNLLGKSHYINTEIGISLISMGWGKPAEGRFFALDISQRVNLNVSYPSDLLKIPITGLDSAMNFDLSGLGVSTMVYTELGMNISRKIGEMITVGWRGKILVGQANIQTSKFDVSLATGQTAWDIKSDIQMNATLPFLDMAYDQDGMIDPANTKLVPLDKIMNIPPLVFNPKNLGLAMDLGVDIRPNDWLEVSASVVDLGSIKWKDKVYNLKNKAEYEFKGVETTLEGVSPIETLVDSLKESFKFSSTHEAYRTWLPTKVFIGTSFYVHPKISFGVLSRTDFYKNNLRQQFTVSANLYPIRMFSTSLSYSVIQGNYKNLGLGVALKLLPFNIYVITDTGPSIYFFPMNSNNLNLRIGLNMMFGCRQKKVVKYDMPLVY